MEATTYQTAALIDRGAEDYMLETAILKVFSTEALWQGVYETLQVYGGQGYFSDEPYERMMRDARINTIGEGANEVLKAFIALVGHARHRRGTQVDPRGPQAPGHVPADALELQRAATSGNGRERPDGPRGHADAPADGRGAGSPGRAVRPDGRAAADRAPRGDPRAAVHPGADRRRRDRPGHLGLHALPMGPLRSLGPATPPSARPPSSTSAWPTVASTSRCAP